MPDYEDDDQSTGVDFGFKPVEIPKERTSKSKLESMYDLFIALMHNELVTFAEQGIPMSASDKNVYLTFFKNNDIVALPDDQKLKALKDDFKAELEAKRINAQSKLMTNINSALVENDVEGLFI